MTVMTAMTIPTIPAIPAIPAHRWAQDPALVKFAEGVLMLRRPTGMLGTEAVEALRDGTRHLLQGNAMRHAFTWPNSNNIVVAGTYQIFDRALRRMASYLAECEPDARRAWEAEILEIVEQGARMTFGDSFAPHPVLDCDAFHDALDALYDDTA